MYTTIDGLVTFTPRRMSALGALKPLHPERDVHPEHTNIDGLVTFTPRRMSALGVLKQLHPERAFWFFWTYYQCSGIYSYKNMTLQLMFYFFQKHWNTQYTVREVVKKLLFWLSLASYFLSNISRDAYLQFLSGRRGAKCRIPQIYILFMQRRSISTCFPWAIVNIVFFPRGIHHS